MGDEVFFDVPAFCQAFLEMIYDRLEFTNISESEREAWLDQTITDFQMLSRHITKMCRNKNIVLMIDEVDQASNHRLFLNFLAMLRKKFLARASGMDFTFHSVILAGVYDVKNIKLSSGFLPISCASWRNCAGSLLAKSLHDLEQERQMMNEGSHTPNEAETKTYNSPWNIAIDFEVDMSFNPQEIGTMLKDYEADHQTGMDIEGVAQEIYFYTSGYPFLVSRICQHIDQKLAKDWHI